MDAHYNEDQEKEIRPTSEPSHHTSASLKLERRRRIEDLNEERRLRDELTEF